MFRNQYDGDVTVFSPQGRIHQAEYAMEAVKQGSATVGIKSKNSAVIVALKRAANDLMDHQKKIVKLDTHMGISIAGLLSDGRILSRNMENECIDYRWAYNKPIPVQDVVEMIEDKSQGRTQGYGRRPFGVGLLVAAVDSKGPHVLQTCPSGFVYEVSAMSIGARSQSARTYLERHLKDFPDATPEALIHHALLALRETLPSESTLSAKNTSVAIVTTTADFRLYDDDDVRPFVDAANADAKPTPMEAQAAPAQA